MLIISLRMTRFFQKILTQICWILTRFAHENNQEHLLPSVEDFFTDENAEFIEAEDGRVWIEPKEYESIIYMFIRGNEPEGRRAEHQLYLQMAQVGLGNQYPGANWVGHQWYTRNLKIFVNLTRITESNDERILLIIGGWTCLSCAAFS